MPFLFFTNLGRAITFRPEFCNPYQLLVSYKFSHCSRKRHYQFTTLMFSFPFICFIASSHYIYSLILTLNIVCSWPTVLVPHGVILVALEVNSWTFIHIICGVENWVNACSRTALWFISCSLRNQIITPYNNYTLPSVILRSTKIFRTSVPKASLMAT